MADGTAATPLVWHLCAVRSRPRYDAGDAEVTEEARCRAPVDFAGLGDLKLHLFRADQLQAEVVAAVNGGLLSTDDVCRRYNLSLEEFASWQRAVDRVGMAGLRVTRIQHYRDLFERQQGY